MSNILKTLAIALFGLCLLPSAFSQTGGPTLIVPKHQAVFLPHSVDFQWNVTPNVASYTLQVSENNTFSSFALNTSIGPIQAPSFIAPGLPNNKDLYWRVISTDNTGTSDTSATHSFYLLNPKTLGNLQLWIKGDSGIIMGPPNPLNSVAQWTDYSGKNVQLVQNGNINSRPTKTTEPRLDGAPVVSFDGIDDWMDGQQSLELRKNDQTILIVFNSLITIANTQTRLIQKRGHTSNTGGWCLAPRTAEWNSSLIEKDATNNMIFQNQAAEPPVYAVNDKNYRIVSTVWKNSIGEWHLYTNGRHYIKATEVGIMDGADVEQPFKIMTVGCSWNSPTDIKFYHKGNIAEIMVFHTALDSLARVRAEQYLRNKYVQPVNLGRDIVMRSLCDTVLSVSKPYYSTYAWYNLNDPATVIGTASSLPVTSAGTYSVSVRDTFGYRSSDTIKIDFPALQQPLPNDTSICHGDTVKVPSLLGPSYNYLWSNGATTESLNITQTDLYYVQITYPGRCSIISDSFYVNVDLFTRDATLGPDDTFCPGNTIGLVTGASGAVDYVWSDGSNGPRVTIFSSDTFSVTVTDTLGCQISDTIIATVIPGVLPDVDFVFDSVCAGGTTQFTNLSTITAPISEYIESYSWDFDDNTTDTATSPAHLFSLAGYYDVTLTATTNIGCNNHLTKSVIVFATPTIHYSTTMIDYALDNIDYAGCVGTGYSFIDSSFSTTPPDMISKWDWDFGDGVTSTQQNTTHTYSTEDTFNLILRVETQNSCVAYDTSRALLFAGILDPEAFSLYNPPANTVTSNDSINFLWNPTANTHHYVFQLATDSSFAPGSMILQATTDTAGYAATHLNAGFYYWRVTAVNLCGTEVIADDPYALTIFTNGLFNGMQLWLMADKDVILDTNNLVSAWRDQSGQAHNFLQTDPARQPTPLATALNGHPTVNFPLTTSADSRFMTGGNVLDIGTGDQSIFVVFNASNLNQLQYRIIQKRGTPTSGLSYATGWCIAARQGKLTPSIIQNANATINFNEGIDYQLYDGCYRLLNTVWDNSEGNWKLYINGVLEEDIINPTSANRDYSNPQREVTLGCAFDNPSSTGQSQWFAGNIAEVIVFHTAVDDPTRRTVEEYIRQKYFPRVNLGQDTAFSYGFCDAITLDAGPCLGCNCQYQWSVDGVPAAATTQTFVARSQGVYSVTVTDAFGFTSTDSIIVKGGFNAVSFDDTVHICMDDNLPWDTKLNHAGYTFEWQDGSTDSFYIMSQAGEYYVTVRDTLDDCDDFHSDTVTVVIDSFKVKASLGADTSLCAGNRISLIAEAESAVQFQWTPGGSTDRELTVYTTGDYSIISANIHQCIAEDTIHVDIRGIAPVANFAFNTTCLNDFTFFRDTTEAEAGHFIETWAWDFGDSGTDTVQHPVHIFPDTSSFEVSLLVMDDNECYQKVTRTVNVLELPAPLFTNEQINCANDLVSFFDASKAPLGQLVTNYLWTFGDGGSTNDQDPVHNFTTDGFYPISLQVTTDSGCTKTISDTIEIFPELIVAMEVGNLCFDYPIDFHDASPGLSNVRWFWTFDDFDISTERNPSYRFEAPGTFHIELEVTNAIGCKRTIRDTITVTSKPTVDFANPSTCDGNFYRFTDNSVPDGNDVIISRKWDFGDGSPVSSASSPVHLFDTAGVYNVTLTVETKNGCTNLKTKPVAILAPPSAAFIYTPTYGPAPLIVTFTNQSTNATDYFWDFGDGSTSTEINPIHTYLVDGPVYITLIASNGSGCTDTAKSPRLNVSYESLDLSLDKIHVDRVYTGNCSYSLFMQADVSNIGTREEITSFDISAWPSTASKISEQWQDTFINRQTVHTFSANFIINSCEQALVVCMEVSNPNGLPDEDMSNNSLCMSLTDVFIVIGPYANPTGDFVTLKFLTPSKGNLRISAYNVLGQGLGEVSMGQLEEGYHPYQYDISSLPQGVYLLKIEFNQETRILKYIKQ